MLSPLPSSRSANRIPEKYYETRICTVHHNMLPLIRKKWSLETCRAIGVHAERILFESGAWETPAVAVAVQANGGPGGGPLSTIVPGVDAVAILFLVDPYNAQCKQVTSIRSAAKGIDREKVFQVLYRCDFSPSIHEVHGHGSSHREGLGADVLVRNPDIEPGDADTDSDEDGSQPVST